MNPLSSSPSTITSEPKPPDGEDKLPAMTFCQNYPDSFCWFFFQFSCSSYFLLSSLSGGRIQISLLFRFNVGMGRRIGWFVRTGVTFVKFDFFFGFCFVCFSVGMMVIETKRCDAERSAQRKQIKFNQVYHLLNVFLFITALPQI